MPFSLCNLTAAAGLYVPLIFFPLKIGLLAGVAEPGHHGCTVLPPGGQQLGVEG